MSCFFSARTVQDGALCHVQYMTLMLSVHLRVARSKRGHLVEETQEYIAYHMFQHYKQHPGVPIVILFVFIDADASNLVRILCLCNIIATNDVLQRFVGAT